MKHAPKSKLNFSKQVSVAGYAKHMTEEERQALIVAMNKVGNQLYTNPNRGKK